MQDKKRDKHSGLQGKVPEIQKEFCEKVHTVLMNRYDHPPLAFVHSYGCQQNVSDGERIKGLLGKMGYGFTTNLSEADLVLYNTCAVRAHAEDRVFGNVGALKHYKARRPDMLIGLCGCMIQQEHVVEKLQKSYPYVDFAFGTHVLHKLPELLYTRLNSQKRLFDISEENSRIVEGIPIHRDGDIKGWLPIMYGCDNFCSYCIVPYVRGRERSRKPQDILAEARDMLGKGIKDITLLGQNVNSYGKGLDISIDFSDLLSMLNDLPGEFRIRFMTSHPKDATRKLIDTMANCDKVAKQLHLPVQSGNNRILSLMNRGYTRETYLDLIAYAKEKMPEITLSSDIIVGFPSETYEEFCDTLSLIEEVGYDSLFTFLFSKRKGTKAYDMEDPIPYKGKSDWLRELLAVQEKISSERNNRLVGQVMKVLIDGGHKSDDPTLEARTDGNILVTLEGQKNWIGQFAEVEITQAMNFALKGKLYHK